MTKQEQQDIFQQWVREYKGLIFKIVRAYAFNEMDREDLFQEICLQVWRSVPSFKHESSVATWLYRITLNTSIRWSGKQKKFLREGGSIDDPALIPQPENVHHDERLDWLYKQIAAMGYIERSITLLLLEGLSYKEIAAIVGITESNIGVKINRIKKKLTIQSSKINNNGI